MILQEEGHTAWKGAAAGAKQQKFFPILRHNKSERAAGKLSQCKSTGKARWIMVCTKGAFLGPVRLTPWQCALSCTSLYAVRAF